MSTMSRRARIIVFLAQLTLLAPAGTARGAPPTVSTQSLRDSLAEDERAKFDEGSRLYRESRFAEAREAFLVAYATSNDPRLLFNVAVCDKALGRYARAIATLKKSLATTGRPLPADYTQRAAEAIATLSRYVAFLTIESPLDGASFSVDGEPVRELPVALETGPHVVVATKDGYEAATQTVTAIAGEALRVTLAPAPSTKPGIATVTCVRVARCEIRVGDELLGAAPVTFSRGAGSYVVRATVNGRAWSEQRVELQNGRVVQVALVGRELPVAHLRVTTDRADDAVVVDGQKAGRSGIEVEVPTGEHRVVISRRDGPSKTVDVLLRDNETRDLRVTLDEPRSGISAWWFVGGGALLAGAATVVFVATRPTKFEGSAAGTLNPYVVPAHANGGGR